ncbi:MAG: Iron-chelate-transporting ATPase [Paenibacillaceae bacterium]|jgi:iron complex transport system ATP-binding protein|nr:Iron-chelate-transporting ATPase [Paenibacillaceae bacterium]
MLFEMRNMTCGYGAKKVLEDFSVQVDQGEVVCLLGPNGVGKTTMFKSALGFLKPLKGEILVDGIKKETLPKKEFARMVGYVPQSHEPPFPFRVMDVVVMGRTAHLKSLESPGKEDYLLAHQAIDQLGIGYLKDKVYTQISGGERQMVLIARALAQQPKLLIMDEPTANLDFGNQILVLKVIRQLAASGLGVLMTSHNPDHAFLCCTKVVLITRSKQVITGPVDETITKESLFSAYGVQVNIVSARDEASGEETRTCVPALNR